MTNNLSNDLFLARKRGHLIFNQLWASRYQRIKAYTWLAKEMGIPASECHFSLFTLEQCQQAIQLIEEKQPVIEDKKLNPRRFERRKI